MAALQSCTKVLLWIFVSESVFIFMLLLIHSTTASDYNGQDMGYEEVPEIPPLTSRAFLYNNYITSLHYISFAGQTKIFTLRLDNNRISVIDSDAFRDLDKLWYLTLNKNLLTVLPPFADVADTIINLSIQDNNIESLTNIPTCPNLQKFYATPHFHTLPAGIFDGFQALYMVWMVGGSLVEIGDLFPNGSSTVAKLLFGSNYITKLPDLSLYTNLQEANFQNNLIPFISVEEFVSVSSSLIVRLEGNPLWGDRDSCLVALSTGHTWSITGTCEDEVLFDCKYGMYRQTSNISRTLVDNKIGDYSDVVRALPVGAAPTTSSFPT